MNLPQIDVSSLPDFVDLIGMFGSHSPLLEMPASDDRLIIIMVYIYEIMI